jgi:hypothetical protein
MSPCKIQAGCRRHEGGLMDGCMNDRDERDERDEIGQGGEIHKTMKSVQDSLRRADQKNARRYMGCDGRKGRDGRTGRALSSLSYISFISSLHSLSSQDKTVHPRSSSLSHTNNFTPRGTTLAISPDGTEQEQRSASSSTGRFLCSFFFPFPFFMWALHFFFPVIRPNETTTKLFRFRFVLALVAFFVLFSFSFSLFFFPLTQ